MNMEFTGERYVPERKGNIELEHMHRYLFAREFCVDKVVLDIACGEGYGSDCLSNVAKFVYGVDIASETIEHAQEKYQGNKNVSFKQGSCNLIPLANNSVDVIVSFETIEHHDMHDKMLEEIKRVLKSDGLLIISSPDKYEYSIKPNYTNPYHVKELSGEEFKSLIDHYFSFTQYFGQKICYGSSMMSEDLAKSKVYHLTEDTDYGMKDPLYWVAVASSVALPELSHSSYNIDLRDSEELSGYKLQNESLLADLKRTQEDYVNLEKNLMSELKRTQEDYLNLEKKLQEKNRTIEADVESQKSWTKKFFSLARPENKSNE